MDKISKLILILDIELVILLGLVTFNFTKTEPVKQGSVVLGVEENSLPVLPKKISVCLKDDCLEITEEELYEDGALSQKLINTVVLEKIYPYFEQASGGKGILTNSHGSYTYWKKDRVPDLTNIFSEIYSAFERNLTTVSIQMKDLPGTNGSFAEKYIEVDNSKQKLYVWIGGKVVKEIPLSAAREGYQVYGVFPIVDKGVNPIAPTGRYMPYWMAFYYSKTQDSWWGLHGLVWWYEDGRAIYEPESNIGVRRSGGCIRMLEKDAKYLYEIFEKGEYILIHE